MWYLKVVSSASGGTVCEIVVEIILCNKRDDYENWSEPDRTYDVKNHKLYSEYLSKW